MFACLCVCDARVRTCVPARTRGRTHILIQGGGGGFSPAHAKSGVSWLSRNLLSLEFIPSCSFTKLRMKSGRIRLPKLKIYLRVQKKAPHLHRVRVCFRLVLLSPPPYPLASLTTLLPRIFKRRYLFEKQKHGCIFYCLSRQLGIGPLKSL